jgi:arginine deiminase
MTLHDTAAYGGPGWIPRTTTLREEIGTLWGACGVCDEWTTLRRVLLHRPGGELTGLTDPGANLMLAAPDPAAAAAQHDALAAAYRNAGIQVEYVAPAATPPPNQMFVADLVFMTPEGAIVGRPAAAARAGEERWVARRLADLGIPILRSVAGEGTFEGADALWLDPATVLLGRGLRTNAAGAAQVAATLAEIGVRALPVDLPHGAMHLMGQIRILDQDLAYVWSGAVPWTAIEALRDRGYAVHFFPSETEAVAGAANNYVTLGPRRILMPAGNPATAGALAEAGVECSTVEIGGLVKAAGAVACLTGVLERKGR